ncbi:unnamed protein product, partial [Prorocentrum cordatum]
AQGHSVPGMLDGGAVSAPLPGRYGCAPLSERAAPQDWLARHPAGAEAAHAAAIQAVLAKRDKEYSWGIINAIDYYILEPILNGIYFVEEAIDEAAEGPDVLRRPCRGVSPLAAPGVGAPPPSEQKRTCP